MVVLGIDVHKGTHTVAAVDEVGRQVGQRTVRATDAGHRQLLGWALREFADPADPAGLRFAVEDCRHVSGRLERALLAAGQQVVRVPPKLMTGARASARTRGKSDPIDAVAIARAALREPGLPVARHDSVTRELKLLVDHREDLVNARTQAQNRLRWHLHELDPDLDLPARSLDRLSTLDRLAGWLDRRSPSLVARIAAELVADIRALTVRANTLERELANRMRRLAPGYSPCPAAAHSPPRRSSGRPRTRTGSAPRPASPCTPASPRSPPPPARPAATGSPAAATGNSTPPSTASPSPRSASPAPAATTTNAGSPSATPNPKPSAP
jgi:transposase